MIKFIKKLTFFVVIVLLILLILNIKIRHIDIVGTTKYTDEELISNIFTSKYDDIAIVFYLKDKLIKHKNLTYIEKYEVKWETPFSIKIVVYEKEAIGYVKKDINYVYFDKDGVIEEISLEKKENIPEVKGINFVAYEMGQVIEVENKNLLNQILYVTSYMKNSGLPFYLLNFDINHEMTLHLEKIQVLLGDNRNLEVKLQRLKDIYPEIKDLSGTLDLRAARDNMLDERYIFKKIN